LGLDSVRKVERDDDSDTRHGSMLWLCEQKREFRAN
jgi:hypothetical protein